MCDMKNLAEYVCGKFYYVVYTDNNSTEYPPIKGLLVNYNNGNIVLLVDGGIYHISYSNILLMKPIVNFSIGKCSKEYQKVIQSLVEEK